MNYVLKIIELFPETVANMTAGTKQYDNGNTTYPAADDDQVLRVLNINTQHIPLGISSRQRLHENQPNNLSSFSMHAEILKSLPNLERIDISMLHNAPDQYRIQKVKYDVKDYEYFFAYLEPLSV